jgi:hypothetical protein
MEKKYPKLKMSKEELQQYLLFKHRGKIAEPVKGKGTKYKRCRDRKIDTAF